MAFQVRGRTCRLFVCIFVLSSLNISFAIHAARASAQSIRPAVLPSSIKTGAWLGYGKTGSLIKQFQSDSGRHLDVMNIYEDWSYSFAILKYTVSAADSNGTETMISWYPHDNTVSVASGKYDSFLTSFAAGVKAYGKPILLRPMWEMNGNWDAWDIGDSHINTNATYIQAWQHIVNIFRAQDATNAQFIWSVNYSSLGTGASLTGAFPGDSYVDYVGIDGYNWGVDSAGHPTWYSFDRLFSGAYATLSALTAKPLLITEMASSEEGGDKAAWISDAYQQLAASKYARIVGVFWFNENKERDWRIESSPTAQQAFYRAMHG